MVKPSEHAKEILERWRFDWGAMDVMIAGKSSIDLSTIPIRDWDDATRFITSYGYNPDDPIHARFIHATIIEAFHFLEKHLIPADLPASSRPPEEILAVDDVRHFLLWAAEKPAKHRARQAWACALLRILHTIAHIEGVYRMVDLNAARDQIMRKFREHVFRAESGGLAFGRGEQHVSLHAVEWKHSKSRESIILKLLHKRANVAETIYDLLGIRIVTERLHDVMRVVKYLREFYLITFPNCNPSRARNSLIDLAEFQASIEDLRAKVQSGKMDPDEFEQLLTEQVRAMPSSTELRNPHSGTGYRSIQLTCRELIHVPNPLFRWRTQLLSEFGHLPPHHPAGPVVQNLADLVTVWGGDTPETANFFPFEVHILDRPTYERNQVGNSAHDRYKQSQIKAARRRVLSRVLRLPAS